MRRCYHLPLAMLFILVLSPIASAAIVVQSFTGIVDRDFTDIPNVMVGGTVNITIKYNTDVTDLAPPENVGLYHDALLSIEIGLPDTGDYWLFEPIADSLNNNILIENDNNSDDPQLYQDSYSLVLEGLTVGSSIKGKLPDMANVGFRTIPLYFMPDMVIDDSLPVVLGDYQIGWVTFEYGGSAAYADSFNFIAAPVPIPATIWFLGSGIVGLVGLRRKMKK